MTSEKLTEVYRALQETMLDNRCEEGAPLCWKCQILKELEDSEAFKRVGEALMNSIMLNPFFLHNFIREAIATGFFWGRSVALTEQLEDSVKE